MIRQGSDGPERSEADLPPAHGLQDALQPIFVLVLLEESEALSAIRALGVEVVLPDPYSFVHSTLLTTICNTYTAKFRLSVLTPLTGQADKPWFSLLKARVNSKDMQLVVFLLVSLCGRVQAGRTDPSSM